MRPAILSSPHARAPLFARVGRKIKRASKTLFKNAIRKWKQRLHHNATIRSKSCKTKVQYYATYRTSLRRKNRPMSPFWFWLRNPKLSKPRAEPPTSPSMYQAYSLGSFCEHGTVRLYSAAASSAVCFLGRGEVSLWKDITKTGSAVNTPKMLLLLFSSSFPPLSNFFSVDFAVAAAATPSSSSSS